MPYHQGLLPPRRQPDDLGGLLDPNIDKRGMLLPFGRTKQGEMEFAVPEILLSLARSARLPGRVAQGYPWTPEDVTEMALNVAGTGYLGGGLLTGGVPKGTVLGANVWHGGPNRWMPEPGYPQGRPLLSRVGTGEGAQAYGHGFYSAESKGVAESYYQALSKKKFDALSKEEQALVPDWVSNRILQGDPESGVNSAIIEFTNRMQDDIAQLKDPNVRQPWLIEERIAGHKKRIKALEKLETSKDFGATETGSLKKLDIPDEDIAKFLDWDAPLSEQSPEAAKRLRALADEIAAKDDYDIFESAAIAAYRGEHPRGARAADIKAEEFYNDLTGVFEGQVGASEALRKAGIPGLKYYDQMSRPKYSISTLEDNIFNVKDILKNLEGKPGPQAAASRRNNLRNLKLWEQELEKTKALKQTRNYVVWDQDVLNRTRILESGEETVGLLKKPRK